MPRKASAVSRAGSVMTPGVETPSRWSCSRMKRPKWSSPTRVSSPVRSPSRAPPTAVLVGLPPMYLAKDCMSSRRPPVCSPYRSMHERPMAIRSNGGAVPMQVVPRSQPGASRSVICNIYSIYEIKATFISFLAGAGAPSAELGRVAGAGRADEGIGDDQGLGQAHGGREGAELAVLRLLDLQYQGGRLGHRADRAVGDRQYVGAVVHGGVDQVHRFLGVGTVADHQQQVVGA